MKKLSGRKILGVFVFCFVSIVVSGFSPSTKRNDLGLRLSQLQSISTVNIFTISSEIQSFQTTSNAVIQQHCVVNTTYNNTTGKIVLPVHIFLKSKFKYNHVAPVPQAQVAAYQLLTFFTNMLRLVTNDCSACAFHTKWLASGNLKSLQITSKTRSL